RDKRHFLILISAAMSKEAPLFLQVWSSQGTYLRSLGQAEGLTGITSPVALTLSPKGRRLAILDGADSR
ncbi:MAG: hypothetical protein ACK55Z_00030, partial [bacterium]